MSEQCWKQNTISNATKNMPKEIGISNKDFGTYLKDDPSESKLPTNSLFQLILY